MWIMTKNVFTFAAGGFGLAIDAYHAMLLRAFAFSKIKETVLGQASCAARQPRLNCQ
jgi:hypothetical protein